MTFFQNKQAPTYLHFLDRELRRAENANYTDALILDALITSVINSLSYCYSSASLLLESTEQFPVSTDLLLQLEKFQFVTILTNEYSFDEFIESRRAIYAHKSSRYPMYFTDGSETLWPTTPKYIDSSTTSILRGSITNWLDNPQTISKLSKDSFPKTTLKCFEKILYQEKEKAITLDLFLKEEQLNEGALRRNSGRLISYFYTKRYIDLLKGDILCNLPQLSFYDGLSLSPHTNNSYLIKAILKCCSIPDFFYRQNKFSSIRFLELISNKLFKELQIELFATIHSIVELIKQSGGIDIYKVIKFYQSNSTPVFWKEKTCTESFLSAAYANLYTTAAKISRSEKVFLQSYSMTKQNLTTNKKVLLVTATSTEAKAVFEALEKQGKNAIPITLDKITLWNFGVVNNSELHLLKIGEMGSSKPSGSALVIYDAIKLFKPDYVIMAGIAFGLKRSKQKIGEVLVSRELEDYDSSKRIATGRIQRGHRIPAGITLLNRFDNSSIKYTETKVELGYIISGDSLSDDKNFVDELISLFPEAIGGEMEGTGLQSSCHRDGVEWILVKGICDWGYDKQHENKERDQENAIKNVCSYIIYTLTNFEL